MTQQSLLAHQNYIPIPKMDTPFTNPDGTVSWAWYRTFIAMWQRVGGASVPNPSAVAVSQASSGALQGTNVATGQTIPIVSQGPLLPGQPAQPLAPSASPFIFVASDAGTLITDSGKVEISRDSGVTWYQVSLVGCATPMLPKDQVRVTWFNEVPTITFLPD